MSRCASSKVIIPSPGFHCTNPPSRVFPQPAREDRWVTNKIGPLHGATRLHKARVMPKEFKQEVEKELTGRETEPWEIIYSKLYQSQMPVIERAIETAALMPGSDRPRGYCLEMICADFLAGANLDHGDPEMLLLSMTRFFRFLPEEQREAFLGALSEKAP